MNTKKIIFLVTFVLFNLYAGAQTQLKLFNDKTKSRINYAMNHPLHAWTGESKDVSAVIVTDEKKQEIYNAAVSVKIATFDSKNANRDSHMLEVTEALLYPAITFVSTSITKLSEDKLLVKGTMTFHGVRRDVSCECLVKRTKNNIEVTGKLVPKMSEYKIDPPRLLAMPVDDEIKIDFKLVF